MARRLATKPIRTDSWIEGRNLLCSLSSSSFSHFLNPSCSPFFFRFAPPPSSLLFFFYFVLSLTLSLSLSPFRSFRSPCTTHFSFIAVALSPPASLAFPFLRPHLCASSSPDSARGTRRQYNTQKSRLASHLRFLFLPDLQPRNSPPIFALFTQPHPPLPVLPFFFVTPPDSHPAQVLRASCS